MNFNYKNICVFDTIDNFLKSCHYTKSTLIFIQEDSSLFLYDLLKQEHSALLHHNSVKNIILANLNYKTYEEIIKNLSTLKLELLKYNKNIFLTKEQIKTLQLLKEMR